MKNYFFGKYYKFISPIGYSFAFIAGNSKDGGILQLVTKEKAILSLNKDSIHIVGNRFIFKIDQEGLTIAGELMIGELHPLKRKVMGPFHYVPFMECKHMIDSMYHKVEGTLTINDQRICFDNGYGYIEGDKGRNFPKQYIWYNSVIGETSVTFAVAHIPFGLFSFTGVLGFIKDGDKEYYLSTYNGVKVLDHASNHIVLKKGDYSLEVNIDYKEGLDLKAPILGSMKRYIKENVAIPSRYTLAYKGEVILNNEDKLSSYEWVYE